MKKALLKTRSPFLGVKTLLLSGVLMFSFSCSNDSSEIVESEDENQLEVLDTKELVGYSSKTTPLVGGIYTITCVNSNRTLDIENKSNSNGADLQVWGTDVNTTGTHRQWEVLSTDGDYVRLKGVDSGKCLEVSGGSNSNNANVQQWSYQGTTHQQWEILPVGDNNYRLKNRDSGKSLRVSGTSNGSTATQYAYQGWNSQKFYFTEVGGDTTGGGTTGGGSDTPSDILPDLQYFKLTYPLDSSGDDNRSISWSDLSDDYKKADEEDNLVGFNASSPFSTYFYGDNDEVVFRAHCAGALTSSGSYPRCELRETPNGGDDLWEFSDEHVLEATFRITHLPNEKEEVCVLQIKGNDSNNTSGTEEAFRLEYRQDGSQGMHATINEDSTETDIMDYNLGDTIEARMYVNNGNITITLNNTTGGDSWSKSYSSDYSHGYFKAGCYTQSSIYSEKNGVADENNDAYGEVKFSELNVTGTNN